MTKKEEIQLDPYFEEFIRKEVTSGKYDSVSDVVWAALKLLEEEEKLNTLRAAIQEGIDSGIVEDFDPEQHLRELKTGKH